MPERRRTTACGIACAALLATALPGCSSGSSGASPSATSVAPTGASGFDGAALPGAGRPVADFTLRDQRGVRVSLSSYRGRVTIVAFPYTTCDSTCMVIAEQIRGALDELGSDVPVLLVSADPAADTPARIGRFLARTSLTGRAVYLTGSRAQLRRVWRSFRVVPASAGARAFDQSATVFVLDRAGRERVLYQLEQLTPEALSHDVRKLL